jgi:hypothetical protein
MLGLFYKKNKEIFGNTKKGYYLSPLNQTKMISDAALTALRLAVAGHSKKQIRKKLIFHFYVS